MPEAKAEQRPSTVVVTGENRAEFMNRKLEIAAPPKKEEAAPVKEGEPKAEPKVEVKAEPKAEPQAEEPKERKEKHGISERMSELTQQRKTAQEEAAKEREARIAAEKKAAELEAKLAPAPKKEEANEPKRDQFASEDEFAKAMIDYRVEEKLAARDKARIEAEAKAEQDRMVATWRSRVTELKKEMPDYEEVINSSKVMVHDAVRDAIFDSDVGPRILVHLAENDGAEGMRIAKMPLVRALKEIGKLEDKYLKKPEAKAEPKQENKPEPKKEVEISKAPAPISPLRGASAPAELPIDAQGNFTGTYKQFKELVNAGKIK